MAALTQTFLNKYDGLILGQVTFDDVTGAISTITITNNGAPTQITVELGTYAGAVLWTRTVLASDGVKVYDATPLGASMIKNSKGFWIPPYTIATY